MVRSPFDSGDRGLSPVVGSALLLAIVVLLVSVSAVLIFGATDEKPPAPTADLELDPVEGSNDYVLVMNAGDTIDGDRITLRGVQSPETLAGSELVAGEEVRVTPTDETIRVVWTEDAGDPVTYTLRTFEVDGASTSGGSTFEDGTVFTESSDDIISIVGDGGPTSTIVSSGNVEGLGSPGPDVTGDGSEDLPFVTSSQEIKVVDADGDVTKLADSGDVAENIDTTKTRLAVGSWNGSSSSVFFTNTSSSGGPQSIYRTTASGGATQVASPSNGADAVVGPTDIDDDGDDELVFADGSQTIRYIESDGTVQVPNEQVTAGSSNGIGSGSTGTLDGYSGDVVSVVNGGNDIYVLNSSKRNKISATVPAQAKQSPSIITDIDDDGDNELVYVGNSNGNIKYIDGFGGTLTVKFLRDDNGNKIGGSSFTGVG